MSSFLSAYALRKTERALPFYNATAHAFIVDFCKDDRQFIIGRAIYYLKQTMYGSAHWGNDIDLAITSYPVRVAV
jgi:hypothetical protein